MARYNGPGDGHDRSDFLAIDDSGNVYVTGHSDGNDSYSDYATIKYDPNGNILWLARYDGPGNYYDRPSDLAIDDFGNTYVTGYSYGDETDYDFATIKYDPNGNQLWVTRYDGLFFFVDRYHSKSDHAHALAIDNEGCVYVTGYSSGLPPTNYTTVKYDPNGNEQWAAFYQGPSGGGDVARDIAVDGLGNVYVTGESYGTFTIPDGTVYDYATIKYDPNGNQLWAVRYESTCDDYPTALAVDDKSCVYVTGYSEDILQNSFSVTVKYDSNGNELWTALSEPPLSYRPYDVQIDNFSNVYITGLKTTTIKYDPNGNQVWLRTKEEGSASALALDKSGNIYVTGRSSVDYATQGHDYTTIKYDPNGNEIWQIQYNGLASDNDWASDIAINDLGDVYITGYSNDSNEHTNFATIRYTQHGYCIGPIEGDFNDDCKVDFVDIAFLAQDWLDDENWQNLVELCENWLNCGFALLEDCM